MIMPAPPIRQALPKSPLPPLGGPVPTPDIGGVGASPAVRVAQQYGADIMKLGALEVKPTGINEITVRFDVGGREHVVKNVLADTINGVNILTKADIYARCGPPEPINPIRAAKLIANAGITGVTGADVRSTRYGSPTMHVQVASERIEFVKNLLSPVIGGAPVVIDAIALPA